MESIDQLIAQKIREIDAVSSDLPSVIIIHDVRSMSVAYMSAWGLDILGVTMGELKKLGPTYFTYFFHPEDQTGETGLEMVLENDSKRVFTLFQHVSEKRAKGKREWGLYLTAMKILLKDETGEPVLTIACAHPIRPDSSITEKVKRLIEESTFNKSKRHLFESLSKREKEILKMLAQGKTNERIAAWLCISSETVKTHRKNLKKKLGITKMQDLNDYAKAFDLV